MDPDVTMSILSAKPDGNKTASSRNDAEIFVFISFMGSIILTMISIVFCMNLCYRCWRRFKLKEIDRRMKMIELENTVREDDLDEEIREMPKVATELSDEDVADNFKDVEKASVDVTVKKKKRRPIKDKNLLRAK